MESAYLNTTLGVPILSDYSGRSGRLGACHAIGCRILNLPILLCSGGENVDCRIHACRKRRDSLLEKDSRTEVFLVLCLRVVVAITNYEQGDDPSREKLTL